VASVRHHPCARETGGRDVQPHLRPVRQEFNGAGELPWFHWRKAQTFPLLRWMARFGLLWSSCFEAIVIHK